MSLVNLAHVCSHLTNASKARLGLTSIPWSNMHLQLAVALQKAGFISTVVRAGTEPPPAHPLLSHPTASAEVQSDSSEDSMYPNPGYEIEPITRANISSRRLWLGMKYWNSEPVLGKLSLVSKPTRRIHMDTEGLSQLVRGSQSGLVKGLREPGECLFVSTDRGILESRECVERKVGGVLLCRAH